MENPNSVAQMKQWLSDQGVEAESLGKKDVAKMIEDDDIGEDVTEALRLRQQLAKSSVKKYQAMQTAVYTRIKKRTGIHLQNCHRRMD